MASAPSPLIDETDVFLRLWERQNLTRTLARHLLKLGFDTADKARMHALAVKNQEGTITPHELRELDNYLRAGMILTILQARARRLLRKTTRSGRGRG